MSRKKRVQEIEVGNLIRFDYNIAGVREGKQEGTVVWVSQDTEYFDIGIFGAETKRCRKKYAENIEVLNCSRVRRIREKLEDLSDNLNKMEGK